MLRHVRPQGAALRDDDRELYPTRKNDLVQEPASEDDHRSFAGDGTAERSSFQDVAGTFARDGGFPARARRPACRTADVAALGFPAPLSPCGPVREVPAGR